MYPPTPVMYSQHFQVQLFWIYLHTTSLSSKNIRSKQKYKIKKNSINVTNVLFNLRVQSKKSKFDNYSNRLASRSLIYLVQNRRVLHENSSKRTGFTQ